MATIKSFKADVLGIGSLLNISLETLNSGQFTTSTQVMIPNYLHLLYSPTNVAPHAVILMRILKLIR